MQMKQDIEKNDTHTYTYIKSNWDFFFRKTNRAFCIKGQKKKKLLCKTYVNKLDNVEQMTKFLGFPISIKKKKNQGKPE